MTLKLRDPRLIQVAILGSLCLYGAFSLDLDMGPSVVVTILLVAQVTQALATRYFRLPSFDPRSPLITGLSLSLLLRTSAPAIGALAAVLAIGSKFLVRYQGKHVFNPANLGIGLAVLLTGQAWISPGQWGSSVLFTLMAATAGSWVIHRSCRTDITWAFLSAYAVIRFSRGLWLGDPWNIAAHQLQNGSLLIFAFFMISDPKTTPNARPARWLYGTLVAAMASVLEITWHLSGGPIWALLICAPFVPLFDQFFPARRFTWPGSRSIPNLKDTHQNTHLAPGPALNTQLKGTRIMHSRSPLPWTLLCLLLLTLAPRSEAFCGFYVARADTRIFNQASQVVLVRDGDRTVITMANDFSGAPEEFAVVIPVPTVIEKEQIHVASMALVDHLDAYTAPRLVEYFDPDPCQQEREFSGSILRKSIVVQEGAASTAAAGLGVTIEASYTVGEYDILILSAEQSGGLVTWLSGNGYRIPEGAEPVVGSYLKQGMKFFVAKVNLEEKAALGFSTLRPLQVAFETSKFMLPIRLGTINAKGAQELFVYFLTRKGRVETTNYRTVKLPSDVELPTFLKNPDEFASFYRDMFHQQVAAENHRAVFLEYAWDMAWCDPCAADPLTGSELRELGVFWVNERNTNQAQNAFVTRLHLRYDGDHFPDDLRFHQTADRSNFQGRYILRHPWQGEASCAAANDYRRSLPKRFEKEAQRLASLTQWPLDEIRQKMGGLPAPAATDETPWWRRIWGS